MFVHIARCERRIIQSGTPKYNPFFVFEVTPNVCFINNIYIYRSQAARATAVFAISFMQRATLTRFAREAKKELIISYVYITCIYYISRKSMYNIGLLRYLITVSITATSNVNFTFLSVSLCEFRKLISPILYNPSDNGVNRIYWFLREIWIYMAVEFTKFIPVIWGGRKLYL